MKKNNKIVRSKNQSASKITFGIGRKLTKDIVTEYISEREHFMRVFLPQTIKRLPDGVTLEESVSIAVSQAYTCADSVIEAVDSERDRLFAVLSV